MNWEELVQTVKQKTNLVELIAETVDLHKSGMTYVGLCPFPHGWRGGKAVYDTKPSLVVYPVNSTYYCYGCGAGDKEAVHGGGSDAIGWIQNLHNVDFKDAVRILAERLGIDASAPHVPTVDIAAWEQADSRDRLFRQTLLSDEVAMGYLRSRGITQEAINHGRLGFVPYSTNSLAAGRLSIGICAPPLKDGRILVAGHAYRSLDNSTPKYLLDKTSPSFSRRNHLYLFNQNLEAIRSLRYTVLTEGFFDALSLWSHGVENACAIMGTILTKEQADLLKRYVSKVALWMDGDAAGRRAVLGVVSKLYEANLQIDVIECAGLDPDEFARTFSGDLKDFIENEARPAWEWLLVYAFRERLNSPFENWGQLRSKFRSILESIPDRSLASSVLKEFNKIDN